MLGEGYPVTDRKAEGYSVTDSWQVLGGCWEEGTLSVLLELRGGAGGQAGVGLQAGAPPRAPRRRRCCCIYHMHDWPGCVSSCQSACTGSTGWPTAAASTAAEATSKVPLWERPLDRQAAEGEAMPLFMPLCMPAPVLVCTMTCSILSPGTRAGGGSSKGEGWEDGRVGGWEEKGPPGLPHW